jgi:hypothetical protein
MARINISQILMKRGNTTAANTYVGPLGELVVDTGLRTVRVQDGVTAGGMTTLATNVQLQALGTYANATFGTSSYGNANVALYLPTSSIIGNINSNITAANASIISLTSNAATQATLINAINANITAANAAITSLTSNAAIQASLLDTLTGNAATQATVLDTLTSNAATQSVSLTTLLSNAATQQTSLTDLVANAAIQAQAIANAAGTYGNANVATYLTGNITTGNLYTGGLFYGNGLPYVNTGVVASYAYGINASQNLTGIGTFTILFSGIGNSTGNDISLDTNSGNVTLQAGKTYRITGAIGELTAAVTNNLGQPYLRWVYSGNNTVIGSSALIANNLTYGIGSPTVDAVLTPTTVANIKLQLYSASGSTLSGAAISNSWFDIQVIGGYSPIITYGNATVESYIGANIGTLYSNAATQATSINAITANIGSFYTYANLNYGTSSYANANVAAYLSSQNISSANIGAYQTFANANAATQTTSINSINANLGAYQTFANSNAATQATGINTVNANLGAYQTYGNLTFSTVANAATQATSIDTITANLGAYQTYANGNATTQATSINTVNANLGAYQTYGNLTFSTVANAAVQSANIATLFSNAATQAGTITTLQTQVYANANVATYLPTYSGAISANIAKNGYTWTFGTNGTTQFPGSQILAPAGESITMQSDQYSQLMWENANVTVAPNMAINSNFYVTQNNATLDIGYRDGSSTQLIKSWYWSVDGIMTLPTAGRINFDNLSISSDANVSAFYAPSGNVQLAAGIGDAQIVASSLSDSKIWNFGANANLTLPETGYLKVGSGIVPAFISSPAPIITGFSSISAQNFTFLANGVNILSTVAGTYANANVATYLPTYTGNIAGNIVKNGYTWTFSNTGTTTFPTGVRLSNARGANTVNFTTDIDKSFQIETQTSTTSRLWSFGTDGNLTLPQFANINFSNGVNILSTVSAGSYGNTEVAAYLPTYSGNVRALNFVGATQAQVGSSFAYATDAFGSLYDSGQVFLTADTNSNAIVAGYTIVGNSGAVTLTVTSATFVAGSPNFVQVATTPTASSFAYPVTVYSADYVAALPNSSLTVGNATISGNVTAPRYLFANGVNILSTVGAGSYSNTQVASYLLHFDGDIEFTSSTAKIGNVDVITVMDSIRSPAYQFSNGTSIFDGITSGGSTYSNANVVSLLAANTAVFVGNVGNVATFSLQANNTQVFIGGNAVIASGNANVTNSTSLLHNMYFAANGTRLVRNTGAGVGTLSFDPTGFTVSGLVTVQTANSVPALPIWIKANASGLFAPSGFTTSTMTASGTVAVNGANGITTTQTTFPIVNATATTINMGGAATNTFIGANSAGTGSNVFVGNTVGTLYSNLTVRARGVYNQPLNGTVASGGGYPGTFYTNVATTGGSGTGMIVTIQGGASGYLNGANVTNPGTGYQNGDTITIPAGSVPTAQAGGSGASFTLTNYNPNYSGNTTGQADYLFGMDGNLTLPGNVTIASVGSIRFANGVNYASTVTGTYSNANVASYLTEQSITSANIGAYYTFANANLATQTTNINTINANLGAYQTYANATFSTSTYSNTQANALLSSNTVSTISTTGNITTIANVIAPRYLFANGVNILSTVVGTYGNTEANALLSGNVTVGNLITTGNLYGNVVGTTGVYSGNVSINGVTTLAGNLGVNGTQVTIFDSIIGLHTYANLTPWAADDGRDIGIRMHYYNAADKHAFLGLENTTKSLQFIVDATETSSNVTGTFGNVQMGSLLLSNTTTSTTTTTGALIVSGGVGFAGNITAGGNITQQSAYYETYGNISNSGGNLTCNFNLGTTFYAALTANVTANFTNVNAIASTVSGATIIVDQGATAYRVANVQVNGVNQTVKWVSATTGAGTASNTDVMSFSLINLGGGVYRVLGQISNYG